MKNKYDLDKPIQKIDFIKYSPNSLATINNVNSKISISFPREDAHFCLQKSYISVDSEVLKNNDTRYAGGDEKALVNFRPFALFIEAKVTTSLGKHSEKVDNLHIIGYCINFKLPNNKPANWCMGSKNQSLSEDKN